MTDLPDHARSPFDRRAPDEALAVAHLPFVSSGEIALTVTAAVVSVTTLALLVAAPYDEDDHTLWWLSLFAIPPVVMVAAAFAWRALAPRLALRSIRKSLAPMDDARRALSEGGVATLTGTLRRPSDASRSEVIAWVERVPYRAFFGARGVGDASIGPSTIRPVRISSAEDFVLELDDGTRVPAAGGPWRVYDPLDGHTRFGRAELLEGDRVTVSARVALEASADSQADYRAVATRPRIVNDDAVMVPVDGRFSQPPRADERRMPLLVLSIVLVMLGGLFRFVHAEATFVTVARGVRCDRRHLCGAGSWCAPAGGASVCKTDCTSDSDCADELACDRSLGACVSSPFLVARGGQGDSCVHRACASGYECIAPWERPPLADGGVVPERYCVRVCTDDEVCGEGLRCLMPTPERGGFCDREASLPYAMRIVEAMRRDAALPELDAAAP